MRRRNLCVGFALLALGAACSKTTEGAAAPAPESLAGPVVVPEAGALPEGVLGWAMAGDLRGLVKRAEAMAAHAGPVPEGVVGAQLQAGLAALGLKDTSVVDLGAPMAAALLDPKRFPQAPWALAVVTRGQPAVLASLAPVWTQAGTAEGGVLELTRELTDAAAVFQGGAAGPAKSKLSLFLRFRGPLCALAMSREALLLAAPALEARLDAGAPADGLVGGVRLDQVRRVFAQELGMAPAMAKAQLEAGMQAQAAAAPFGDPKRAAAVVGMMVDKAFSGLGQLREVGFALSATPEAGVLNLALGPEEGSFFHTLLAAQRPPALEPLLGLLPRDAFLAAAMDVQWKPFQDDLLAFGEAMLQVLYPTAMPPEVMADMKAMMDLIGEQLVLAEVLDPAGGMQVVEAFAVREEARFLEVLGRLMRAMGPYLSEAGAAGGLRMSLEGPRDLGKAGEAALVGYDFVLDLAALPEPQAAAFRHIYGGDRMRLALAAKGGVAYLAMGPEPEKQLAGLLDRAQAGGLIASPAFKSAAGGLDQNAGAWFYLSLTRMLAWTMHQTQAMLGREAAPEALPPARSGMFYRLGQERGRLTVALRLPAEHLKELGEAFRGLAQGSAPPPPPPKAAPPAPGAR